MALSCPACQHPLQVVEARGVEVDACVGHCGGIWFDNRELQKVDERAEAAGEALLDIPRDPALHVDLKAKRACPKCKGIKLMRHFFSVKRKIEVDECASCGGMWLDADELARIRGEFVTAADREEAAVALFDQQFDKQLAAARAESQADVARAQRFAKVFQWLCPSTYLPGKQQGGAF